jgi:hypothetical protein
MGMSDANIESGGPRAGAEYLAAAVAQQMDGGRARTAIP